MLSNGLFYLIFIVGFAVLVILLRRRADRRLTAWGAAHGYDIVRIMDSWIFQPGPFRLRHTNGWSVKKIVVRTDDHGERIGWVCHPAGFPLFEPPELQQVELVWEDEWKRSRDN